MVGPLAKVLSPCVQYVDVILPLALPGLLTYAVPPEHAGTVRVGRSGGGTLSGQTPAHGRGPRHSRLQARTPHGGLRQPAGCRASAVGGHPRILGLDGRTLLLFAGRGCPRGLPADAPRSETKLQPAPDAEERDDSGLEDREFQVVEALRLRGAMTFKEVGELLGVKDPAPVLRSLVESGWILSNEEMRSGPGERWCLWCGSPNEQQRMKPGWGSNWTTWIPGRRPSRGR